MASRTETPAAVPMRLDVCGVVLHADWTLPHDARGLVVFAHGSGSSRHSPRNRGVADVLAHRGFSTLLLDLLTRDEDQADVATAELRFDIPLLADRLVATIDWAGVHPQASSLPLAVFGASTGAAAALIAAARRPRAVRAVVSRGGRPDLAGDALDRVISPTLLIVGGNDDVITALNERAFERLPEPKRLEIIAGATHLFEEPGALGQVSTLALDWLERYLAQQSGSNARQLEAES